MQKVDQYLQRAKRARARAESAIRDAKHDFESLAEGWEFLAKERLEFLEEMLQRRGTLGPTDV